MSASRLQRQDQVLVELARHKSLHQGNFTTALEDILAATARTLEVERASVWLYSADRSRIDCLDLYERSPDRHSQGLELWSSLYPGYFKTLEQARTIAAHNALQDSRTKEFLRSYLTPLGITSMLDAPIWLGGQMVGVLCNEHIGSPREWTLEEQQFAASISDLLSLAMEARDRQQAREALQASQDRLQSFFMATFETVVIHDQGRIIDANVAAETLFGYTTTELIGMLATELAAPESRLMIRQRMQQADDQPYEAKGVRKDGSTFMAELSGKTIIYQGRPLRVVGVRDITERKQAEAELKLSLQRERLLGEIAQRIRRSLNLQEILDTTVSEVRQLLQADQVLIGFINVVNQFPQAQVMAESNSPDWPVDSALVFNHPSYLLTIVDHCHQGKVKVINNVAEVASELERQYLSHCQVQACLEVPIALINERESSVSGADCESCQSFGVLIADQCSHPRQWQPSEIELLEKLATQVAIAIRQAELYQKLTALNANLEHQVEERTAQLQQNMQELQEINTLKEAFSHAVSHDLRTPVMGTLLVLNNLLHPAGQCHPSAQDSSIAVPRKILERMIESSNRQLNLIDSLLDAHISDAGGMVLHREPTAIAQVVAQTITDLDPLLAKNQATLSSMMPANLPLVDIDPHQLRRVYENLITNALKHNPPGLQLTLNASLESNELVCIVQDDGIGISQSQAEHLFDLYFQGANTRHLTGIGLGLYLCRQVIQAHGGQIGVNSQPGAGATFWFTLPLSESSSAVSP
ncbi:MAG: GAF domain-containing protein [Aphanocapsa sp. GSE-SYN-MK-11-07L]|nr:GAF domain-containing protein [Aphanocapsa sp. GSE-SYN-MK-11-07L]